MNIDSLQSVTEKSSLRVDTGNLGISSLQGSQFAAVLGQQIAETNTALLASESQLRRIASGDATNLHQAMVAMEEASIRLSLLTQIRNKLVDGYHEILKMQL